MTSLKLWAIALFVAVAAWPAPSAADPARSSTCSQIAVDQETEVRILAATMAAESRGEPEYMVLVAEVVVNRAKRYNSPTIAVILQPMQFTPWSADSKIRPIMIAAIEGRPYSNDDFAQAYEATLPIARSVVAGYRSGKLPVDVLHFYNPEESDNALWQTKGREYFRFGKHVFIAGVTPPRFPACPVLRW